LVKISLSVGHFVVNIRQVFFSFDQIAFSEGDGAPQGKTPLSDYGFSCLFNGRCGINKEDYSRKAGCMTQLSPANQRLNQLLRGIPAKLETRLKELLYGIHKHRPGELTTALKTIAALEYRLFLTQDPQKLAVAETWGLLLHEAYENDPEGTADCFHVLLPEARRFFSECDDLPAIYDHLTFLFHGAERFLRTTLNDSAGPNGYQDLEPVFSEVIRTLAAAARSRSFPAWARAEHLNFSWPDLFASWRTHQTHLLLQRRPLPFWDLVWLQLELVTAHPLLKIECSSLPQLLILARQAFFLQTPHKPDRMEIRLQDVAAAPKARPDSFLTKLLTSTNVGLSAVSATRLPQGRPR
jgi:hypothetical protein